jgi:hypothetical protein
MNRYQDIKILREQKDNKTLGPRYRKGTKYPEVPFNENDIYVITTQGDRYDLLAQQYYNDYTLWWIIVIANVGDYTFEIPLNSLFIPVGTQIRIPVSIQNVLSNYAKLNQL